MPPHPAALITSSTAVGGHALHSAYKWAPAGIPLGLGGWPSSLSVPRDSWSAWHMCMSPKNLLMKGQQILCRHPQGRHVRSSASLDPTAALSGGKPLARRAGSCLN